MARRSLLVAPYDAGLVGFGWSRPSTPPPPAESASSTPIAATRRQIRMITKARMSPSPSFSHRCPLRRPRGCQRLAWPIRFGSTLFSSCATPSPATLAQSIIAGAQGGCPRWCTGPNRLPSRLSGWTAGQAWRFGRSMQSGTGPAHHRRSATAPAGDHRGPEARSHFRRIGIGHSA